MITFLERLLQPHFDPTNIIMGLEIRVYCSVSRASFHTRGNRIFSTNKQMNVYLFFVFRELRSFNWTGENQFFINATREFLSMGAGEGHYGLWLDADLNRGRSQRCDTFANEPLAGGQDENFVIQLIEVFGFSMG